MKKMFSRVPLILLSAAALAACSVESGGGDNPVPKKDVFESNITGPIVEGAWASNCIDAGSGQYKIMSIEFKGQKLYRSANRYSDSACTQLAKAQEARGIYRWLSTTTYGGYLAEYKLDLGNGWSSITQEEILLENQTLYVSDFVSGFGWISKKFPMRQKDSSTQPAPTPTPAPAPPGTACSDFSGVFFDRGFYTAVSQRACNELVWQPVDSNLKPAGLPDVYIMDGQYRYVGNSYLKATYKNSSFTFDFQSNGRDVHMDFSIVQTRSACGQDFGTVKTILLRKTSYNGYESASSCVYWEKIK